VGGSDIEVSADPIEPFALVPGAGLSVENPVGGSTTFKAMSDTTGRAITALEGIAAPGEGPPLHVHQERDEIIYVVEGQHRIKLGERLVDAPPGSFVFIPRGTPHTWQNTGAAPGRIFAAVMPADENFEAFFLRYSQVPADERGPDTFAQLAAETRAMEVLGPPLSELPPS
jgi:quercetin dioxygenase-like cupin family protein